MKKADNFNPGKWLVENKITFQSRLNEIDREDWGDPRNQPDDEEADLLAASIMKKGAPIPGYEGQTYMNDTLVGEDGEEFGNYRIYNTYEEAVAAAGTNIYTLDDKYAVTFSNPESKSEFAGKLNEVSKSPNSTTKIVSYFSQYGGSGLFQTVRGINIMKNILKKELKFDLNNTEMDYTIDDEIADKIINNSFYREYIEEGEKAYNILKPIIEKYDSNIKFEDEGFMIDYDVYIGPEVITEDGDFDDLNEYLEQQLGSQYVKSTPEGLSDEIFLMLVQD